MARNANLVGADATKAWLSQFDVADQPYMTEMLRAMRLVSSEEFSNGIRTLLQQLASDERGAIALYVEREVPPQSSPPEPLFTQSTERPRRASGAGPLPIDHSASESRDVGSEGLVAQLLTEFHRESPEKFLNHPSPDELRKRKVRRLVLVTDLIGSGNRAVRYLDAAWGVLSVKSWHSYLKTQRFGFEVVAYASTVAGRQLVESHPLCRGVRQVVDCPTIDSAMSGELAVAVKIVCSKYGRSKKTPCGLGYHNTGALIAFAHGAPNNCPEVLHSSKGSWQPLFPARVTARLRSTFSNTLTIDEVQARLRAMRQKQLWGGYDWNHAPQGALEIYLVLAALSRPPRTVEVLARKTGLTVLEVQQVLDQATQNNWVDVANALTPQGRNQLEAAKATRSVASTTNEAPNMYYPSALRGPV